MFLHYYHHSFIDNIDNRRHTRRDTQGHKSGYPAPWTVNLTVPYPHYQTAYFTLSGGKELKYSEIPAMLSGMTPSMMSG
ncbi:MAG: hypothetical protein ACU83O_11045 [Gammaproteobacteria bacterium]